MHTAWNLIMSRYYTKFVTYNKSWTWSNNSVWIWRMILDETKQKRFSNQSIFREITASKFQGQHAVQKPTAGVFHRIFQNFRTATFENNFGGLFLKRKKRSRRYICKLLKKYSFLTNFLHLDYVIHIYKQKKGLSRLVFVSVLNLVGRIPSWVSWV